MLQPGKQLDLIGMIWREILCFKSWEKFWIVFLSPRSTRLILAAIICEIIEDRYVIGSDQLIPNRERERKRDRS
jgi:hypothetical protein